MVALVASVTFPACAHAQSQRLYDFVEDYGDGTGQTFVTKNTADIIGVRLVIQAFGDGNDVTVRLHELDPSGIPTAEVLTQGVLAASAILPDEPQWYFIGFDSPFPVSAGEGMAFIVDQIGSGPTGFVGYGATNTNPYVGGFRFFQPTPGGDIFPDLSSDFAFEIVYEPCPADINGDGFVNVLDLVDLLLCFGQPAVPGCVGEDINEDGNVNVLDLIELLLAFGTACP